ncbi:MAG: NPCBM/NEW2 domain-containing protein [Planctomycetota bacterium]|nr:NPCBM/NEW2 domain-containing protein [Planctomycetota bacterium]MDG2144253.1 NPCBM/NEW2 domain-containing protein [Planctomycetota bacterium]
MVTSALTPMRSSARAGLALIPLLALAALGLPSEGPVATVESLDGTRELVMTDRLQDASWQSGTAFLDTGLAPRQVRRWGAGAFEVTLHTGDRVLGKVAGGDEESLGMELIGSVPASFSIEEVNHLIALENVKDQSSLAAPESGDRLWRITAGGFDPLDGFLIGFGKEGVTMESDLGTRTTTWDEVASLWIEALEEVPNGRRAMDDEGRPPIAVDFVDGSRLRGHFGGIKLGDVELIRGGGQTILLDLYSIMKISLDDQRQVYLSDRKWLEQDSLSLFGDDFGMHWPTLADRSVLGESLRSDGKVWARGLGVHAPSSVQFDALDGGFLRGRVALDDSVLSVPAKGSVIFHVLLDGKVIWSSEEMTSGDTPIVLPNLPIGKAKTLELRVDEASDSFVGDRANWLDVRIVKP